MDRPMLSRFCALALATVAVSSGAGCGRRPHVAGTVAVDQILQAWGADGFATTAVVKIEPEAWNAGACSRGSVSGLDVLLCEYASDEALAVGEQKMMSDWQQESVATGATARASRTVLAIADRAQADPSGRTVARLIKTFREQR